ncbi:MAG: hypothetical protein FWE14_08085 [Lachnospiraceae bacterium]|nr:hypothetical protein [Lachnospiraceae bacterium]
MKKNKKRFKSIEDLKKYMDNLIEEKDFEQLEIIFKGIDLFLEVYELKKKRAKNN